MTTKSSTRREKKLNIRDVFFRVVNVAFVLRAVDAGHRRMGILQNFAASCAACRTGHGLDLLGHHNTFLLNC